MQDPPNEVNNWGHKYELLFRNFVIMQAEILVPVNLKLENGPLSKLLRSYNLTHSELIPTANIRPSGSKAATGRPAKLMNP